MPASFSGRKSILTRPAVKLFVQLLSHKSNWLKSPCSQLCKAPLEILLNLRFFYGWLHLAPFGNCDRRVYFVSRAPYVRVAVPFQTRWLSFLSVSAVLCVELAAAKVGGGWLSTKLIQRGWLLCPFRLVDYRPKMGEDEGKGSNLRK